LGSEGEQVQALLADFEGGNPGVRVRVQQIPWSAAHEKLLTAFIGDAMPDVFQVGNTWLPELVTLKALAPLDDRIDSSSLVARDDFFPAALQTTKFAGVGYAVPWYVDTRLLFYRADILRAAGYAKPPRTWDSWRTAMRSIRARGEDDSRPILLPVNEWEAPVILALQKGATLLRDGGRYGDFRGKEFRAGFDLYLDLFRNDLATPPGSQVNNPYAAFMDGAFCFYLSGPWSIGELRRRWPASMQSAWATTPRQSRAPAGPHCAPDRPRKKPSRRRSDHPRARTASPRERADRPASIRAPRCAHRSPSSRRDRAKPCSGTKSPPRGPGRPAGSSLPMARVRWRAAVSIRS
jgi:multiple sugar transport system substrate-binding protein